jgi:RNA polymerase sigma-70 factor (ECF subfamily)
MVQSDETLMLAVKNGDTEMFSVLFQRHHPRLFAFFYRMTGDASGSEDLAQDVFVRILKYRSGFDEHNNFRAWMYQIARNANSRSGKAKSQSFFLEPDREKQNPDRFFQNPIGKCKTTILFRGRHFGRQRLSVRLLPLLQVKSEARG